MTATDLLLWCGSNIAIATLLGAVALSLSRWPNAAHTLYVLAFVKLLTPPIVPAIAVPVSVAAGAQSAIASRVPAGAPPMTMPAATQAASDLGPASTVELTGHAAAGLPWLACVLGIWIAGATVASACAWLRIRRGNRCIKRLRTASTAVRDEVEALSRSLGLKRTPAVRVTPERTPPMVLPGLRRATIVLPAVLLAQLSTEQRRAVVLHELAHVRRRDTWVRLLELAGRCTWWWLPLTRSLSRGLRRAEELCCDAVVVAALPHARADYAAALVTSADLVGSHTATMYHACALDPIRNLEQRIQAVLTPTSQNTHPNLGRALLAVVAFVALPICACDATSPEAARAAATSSTLPQTALSQSAWVCGQVADTSPIDLAGETKTVFDAVTRARPTAAADLRRSVLVRRGATQPTVVPIDLRAMIFEGDTTQNVALAPGDSIFIPAREASPGAAILIDKRTIEQGDLVSCLLDDEVVAMASNLRALRQTQAIGAEGTVHVPYVGSVEVAGMTTEEASERIEGLLTPLFSMELDVQVRASRAR